jgi:hypothetical protein
VGNFLGCLHGALVHGRHVQDESDQVPESAPAFLMRRVRRKLSECHFNDLKPQSQQQIVDVLDRNSLQSARLVSKNWFEMAEKSRQSKQEIEIENAGELSKQIACFGVGGLQKITLIGGHPPHALNDRYLQLLTNSLLLVQGLKLPQLALRLLPISNLSPLGQLTQLRELSICACFQVPNLEALRGLSQLRVLNLSALKGVSNLEPLSGLREVHHLTLSVCTEVQDLSPLGAWSKMKTASFSGMKALVTMNEGVTRWMCALDQLHLTHCQGLGVAHLTEIQAAIEARGGYFSHEQGVPEVAGQGLIGHGE